MKVSGGKDKYLCLYSYIKNEKPKLGKLIDDLCLTETFKFKRYKNTFLSPNEKLINKLIKMTTNDEDEEAVELIKKLLLKEHLETKKDFSGEVVNILNKQLDNPEKVATQLKDTKKRIYTSYGEIATIIYNYEGDEPPSATVENKKRATKVVKKEVKMGGIDQKNVEVLKKKTEQLIASNHKQTIKNFIKGVAVLLNMLEKKDKLKYAQYVLSANPILSWYFLTLPGSPYSLVDAEDIKNFNSNFTAIVEMDVYTKALNDVEYPENYFSHVNNARQHLLQEHCGKSTLSDAIVQAYNSFVDNFPSNCKEYFKNNIELKILQDELRFMYEDYINENSVSDLLKHLNTINWAECKKHYIICDSSIYKNLIKPTECFISGPVSFIKSVYFLYIPLTDEMESAILKSANMYVKGGNSVSGGGDPNKQSTVIYKGQSAKKYLNDKVNSFNKHTNIENMYNNLSKKQKEELYKIFKAN